MPGETRLRSTQPGLPGCGGAGGRGREPRGCRLPARKLPRLPGLPGGAGQAELNRTKTQRLPSCRHRTRGAEQEQAPGLLAKQADLRQLHNRQKRGYQLPGLRQQPGRQAEQSRRGDCGYRRAGQGKGKEKVLTWFFAAGKTPLSCGHHKKMVCARAAAALVLGRLACVPLRKPSEAIFFVDNASSGVLTGNPLLMVSSAAWRRALLFHARHRCRRLLICGWRAEGGCSRGGRAVPHSRAQS